MSLLLGRGINVLRNRKEQITQRFTSSSSQEDTDSHFVEALDEALEKTKANSDDKTVAAAIAPAVPKRETLAGRRGKSLLAINLGAGTYFVPSTGSAATTPIQEYPPSQSRRGSAQVDSEGPLSGPSTQHLLGYADSLLTPTSSSAQAGSQTPVSPYFQFGPSSPTSERLAELSQQQVRRKSSVTFADGIPPMAITLHRPPAPRRQMLEVIHASPKLGGQLSLHDALSSNRSEAARSIEKEDSQEDGSQAKS